MKRFALRLLTLWLLLTALCGGVIAVSRANPGPNELQARGFDRCDGQPCYLGIRPGFTTLTDAQDMLFHPAEGPTTGGTGGLRAMILPTPCDDKPVVCSIEYRYEFDVTDAPITVGMLIEQYGTPDGVGPNDARNLELHFPGLTAYVEVGDWERLDVNSVVTGLVVTSNTLPDVPALCRNEPAVDLDVMVCWHGFAEAKRYAAGL